MQALCSRWDRGLWEGQASQGGKGPALPLPSMTALKCSVEAELRNKLSLAAASGVHSLVCSKAARLFQPW